MNSNMENSNSTLDKLSNIKIDNIEEEDSLFMVPEDDNGNQEQKYKICDLTEENLEERTTQMNQRLEEGAGEAIQDIGVTDDGCPLGITQAKMDESMHNLRQMASRLDASVIELNVNKSPIKLKQDSKLIRLYTKINRVDVSTAVNECRFVAEVLIRKNKFKNNQISVRIAVAGNVDAGKSTTVGCLTQCVRDDGNGFARTSVFNYKHEILSGRTSSVGMDILGFNSKGQVVNLLLKKFKAPSWPEIVKESDKIVTFYDMAGHEKYFNTTIRGISGVLPDYALIMIGANMGIPAMTREHMIVCIMRGIPLIIVFTKIDIAPVHILKKNMEKISHLMKGPGVRKMPWEVKDRMDVLNVVQNIAKGLVVPIMCVSNVTDEGMDLLRLMLNLLPSRTKFSDFDKLPAFLNIQDKYLVTGIGTVVSGLLMRGEIHVKSNVWVGPDSVGKFKKTIVKSIQDKRVDVMEASSGQSITLGLRNITIEEIHKGMVLLDGSLPEPKGFWQFVADIEIFGSHATSIKVGYEPVINVMNIQQSARILSINSVERKDKKDSSNNAKSDKIESISPIIRSGDKATVTFQFKQRPMFIEKNQKILFREGRTRGVGIIVDLHENKIQ